MTDQTILVVDDDPKIRTLLRNVMEDEGFLVLEAEGAHDAMAHMSTRAISLVTLDIHLGTDNGIELARDIRRTSNVPIIMVTGKDDVIDRVVGLEVGADDYITKPFHVREVIARVRSVLRRTGDVAPPVETIASSAPRQNAHLSFDGMVAIPDQFELIDRSGSDCGLTSGDFKLLVIFLERPKRVLSRDQLMNLIGGPEWSPLDRVIDNQIARLRKKVERDPSDPKLIKTVRGVGYTFACDVRRTQPPEA
ncbi:DNA-binding response regulator [Sulfitobacter sp. SK012]|uniref:response regulator n=1 Tax=Sulfitobacter sp. SK012 TaxID=1389005 RepID=UPI000E0A58AF|nr:response regulator transcription factor [Sulfitobacter sp. SK012]AXI45253.1 DNA-binding response regulator [Sulfitobacter sp. SK012]